MVGTLVHELFQSSLSLMMVQGILPNVMKMCDDTLNTREFAYMCYENDLHPETVKEPLMDYMTKINNFLMSNVKVPLKTLTKEVILSF